MNTEKNYNIKKLTNQKWLNLFLVDYNLKNRKSSWIMASRKQNPIDDAPEPDAVVIIPKVTTPEGTKLVLIEEFRVPIWDYEFGFPAGLIEPDQSIELTIKRELKEETGLDLINIESTSKPVYSSAGLSDESCVMAIVNATGTPSAEHLEPGEIIKTHLLNTQQIRQLLDSDKKIAAKAWPLLYCFAHKPTLD
jgi:ADP-ribose pyrophosphatase